MSPPVVSPQLLPECYNGKGEYFDTQLQMYEYFASLYWTANQKVAYLPTRLRGRAQHLFFSLAPGERQVSLEELVIRLQKLFQPDGVRTLQKEELRNCLQQAREEFVDLASRICHLAYPEQGQSAMLADLMKDAFVDAITDLDVHIKAWDCPTASIDAVSKALEYQSHTAKERLV